MPGLDGTGPMGQGSRTGRGLGRCNPANDTANSNNNFQRPMGGGMGRGRGCGFGRGFGRGFGGRGFQQNWNNAPVNTDEKGEK